MCLGHVCFVCWVVPFAVWPSLWMDWIYAYRLWPHQIASELHLFMVTKRTVFSHSSYGLCIQCSESCNCEYLYNEKQKEEGERECHQGSERTLPSHLTTLMTSVLSCWYYVIENTKIQCINHELSNPYKFQDVLKNSTFYWDEFNVFWINLKSCAGSNID